MKTLVSAGLALSLLSFAVLGGLAMVSNDGHGHQSCLASRFWGADCPETGAIAMANFHLAVFKYLVGVIFLVFSLLAGLVWLTVGPAPRFPRPGRHLSVFRRRDSGASRRRLFIRWLALHENSPTSL